MAHEMVKVDSGVIRCRCGWAPTYNAGEGLRAAEVRDHLLERVAFDVAASILVPGGWS